MLGSTLARWRDLGNRDDPVLPGPIGGGVELAAALPGHEVDLRLAVDPRTCVVSIALVAPLMPDLSGEVQLTGVEV